jgi:hypothetical protein
MSFVTVDKLIPGCRIRDAQEVVPIRINTERDAVRTVGFKTFPGPNNRQAFGGCLLPITAPRQQNAGDARQENYRCPDHAGLSPASTKRTQ